MRVSAGIERGMMRLLGTLVVEVVKVRWKTNIRHVTTMCPLCRLVVGNLDDGKLEKVTKRRLTTAAALSKKECDIRAHLQRVF